MSGSKHAHPAVFEGGRLDGEVLWFPPPILNYVQSRTDENNTGHQYTLSRIDGPLLHYRLTSVFTLYPDDEDEPNDA